MQRYFADIIDNKVILNEEDKKHLLKVMRSQVNDELEIVFHNKTHIGIIKNISPLDIEVIKTSDENHELDINLVLVVSLLKGEKMDFVIQKATEIGVKEIILLRSEHSIAKIRKDEEKAKLERFSRIAKEASQQSKRNMIPLINKIYDFKEIKNISAKFKFIGAIDETIPTNYLYNELKNINSGDSVYILIGPEGGFSNDEISFAKDNNFVPVSFGKRVLRAETACLTALSIIAFSYEGK